MDFTSSGDAPAVVRRALSVHLPDSALRVDLLIAASELVSNVVRHTHGGGTFELLGGPPIRMEVHDSDSTQPKQRTPGVDGGYGLGFVDAVADNWGSMLTPTGKTVWAEFPSTAGRR